MERKEHEDDVYVLRSNKIYDKRLENEAIQEGALMLYGNAKESGKLL